MKERTEILEETFRKLTEEKKYASLRDLMQTLYPADIAAILSDMPERLMPAIFRLLPKDLAAETFVEMESDVKETLIRSFSDTELKAVIDEMYMDDAVDLIEEMPEIQGRFRRVGDDHGVRGADAPDDGFRGHRPDPRHRRGQGNHQHLLRAG